MGEGGEIPKKPILYSNAKVKSAMAQLAFAEAGIDVETRLTDDETVTDEFGTHRLPYLKTDEAIYEGFDTIKEHINKDLQNKK